MSAANAQASGRVGVAILGSGNIGTDLLIKLQERAKTLDVVMMVGIDPDSEGLARARARGVATTAQGIEGLIDDSLFERVQIVFDATSARAHAHHDELMRAHGRRVIDLTPAAIGPYVVPVANLREHIDAPNVNLVTCGGQATIPVVWAIGQVCEALPYAEIVASIASRSAGPGTRANIDEFTVTTARGIEQVGGAEQGKAIIILNPAEPPLMMRDTVYALCRPGPDTTRASVRDAIRQVVAEVAEYVPGYRLVADPVFEDLPDGVTIPGRDPIAAPLWKVSVFLEVEGAADYLPAYAGNLDIMTSAAAQLGTQIAAHLTARHDATQGA